MISSDPSVEKSEGHFVWSPQWCSAAGTREPLGISPTGFRWFLDGFPCFSIKATIIQPLKINPLIPIELVISLMISPEAMLMVGFIYTHYLLISVISTIRDAYITSPIISPFWLVLYPDLHPDFSRRRSHFHKYTVVHSCTGCLLVLISLKYTIKVVVIWSFPIKRYINISYFIRTFNIYGDTVIHQKLYHPNFSSGFPMRRPVAASQGVERLGLGPWTAAEFAGGWGGGQPTEQRTFGGPKTGDGRRWESTEYIFIFKFIICL